MSVTETERYIGEMEKTQRDRMYNAIGAWLIELEDYPGWKDWRRKRITHTLYFDDPFPMPSENLEDEFNFSDEIEKQHAVVFQYLGLEQAIFSLKDCEFYFRRYPFRGLPVSHHNHITNICEMYFGRFYEFKEKLKKYFTAVKEAAPNHGLDIGAFIKLFEKTFDQELRARNSVHHHRRFEDIAIDRVFLMESFSTGHEDKGWRQEHFTAYRKLAGEWAQRVRQRGAKMDEFLEATAAATLANCSFLSALLSANQKPSCGRAE